MSSLRFRWSQAMRSLIAIAGLIVMVTCALWLDSLPRSSGPLVKRQAVRRQPFGIVVLDPGHGGQDSGAMCGSIMEKDLTLDVARRLERLLQAEGISTIMTRSGDGFVPLADRAALTNRVADCVMVSIHFNDSKKSGSSGIETYYAEHQSAGAKPVISWLPFLQRVSAETPGPNVESQSLAGFVQDSMVARTHAINRGTKTEQFFVISNVRHPAILVEGGFLTNKEETAKLGSEEYREQIAAAIEEGILRYRDLLKSRQATLAVTTPEASE